MGVVASGVFGVGVRFTQLGSVVLGSGMGHGPWRWVGGTVGAAWHVRMGCGT